MGAYKSPFLNCGDSHKVKTQFYLLTYKYCCDTGITECECYHSQTFKHKT